MTVLRHSSRIESAFEVIRRKLGEPGRFLDPNYDTHSKHRLGWSTDNHLHFTKLQILSIKVMCRFCRHQRGGSLLPLLPMHLLKEIFGYLTTSMHCNVKGCDYGKGWWLLFRSVARGFTAAVVAEVAENIS
jgi:hypothetical protein